MSCSGLNVLFCPRQDGEDWKLDSCKTCTCKQGKVRCAMPMCPQLNLPCPPYSKLEHPEGQCCPRCVESKHSLYIMLSHMRLIFKTKNYRFFQVMGFARFLETRTIVRSTVNSTASRGHANINWSTIVPLTHLAYV